MLRIITDSASDLPKNYIEEHHLHVIPTPVVIDDTDYFDGQTIQTKEFYNILDDIKRDVKTYHINPAMFTDAFTPYAQAGDTIIYLCFSTGIAGTYNAANIAKNNVLEDYPDFDLTIIDSRSASIGFGLVVSKLVAMLEKGASKEELIEAADYFISHVKHVFTVQTLAYLIKGGRLTKFKGTLAETLDMKPVLVVECKIFLIFTHVCIKEAESDNTASGMGADRTADCSDHDIFWMKFVFDHGFYKIHGIAVFSVADGDLLFFQVISGLFGIIDQITQ